MFMDACEATPVYNSNIDIDVSLIPSPKKQTNDFEVSKVICNEKTSTWSTGKCCLFCPVSETVEASDSLGPPGKYAKLWTMSFGSRSALMLEYPDSLCIFNPVACSRMLVERIWSPSTVRDAWQTMIVNPGCLISWQIFGILLHHESWFSQKLLSSEERFGWWIKPWGETVAFKHFNR